MNDYTIDERTGILYKRISDYYFPVGNRFGIADDGDEEIEQMLRAAPNDAGSRPLSRALRAGAQRILEGIQKKPLRLPARLRAARKLPRRPGPPGKGNA